MPHFRSIFGSWDIEKYTLLWYEIYIKIKIYKLPIFGSFLQIAMLKKYVRLWDEVNFQIKIYKLYYIRIFFRNYDI